MVAVYLAIQTCLQLRVGSKPQPGCRERARPYAHAGRNVLARDHKVFARPIPSTQYDMGVGILGVPMVDGDPVEPRAQVACHSVHETASEATKIRKLGGVFRRDDEAELVPITRAPHAE